MENITLIRDRSSKSFRYDQCVLEEADDLALVVENLALGICGTDLDLAKNHRSDAASILGHEGVGRVLFVSSKSNSHGFSVGDRVVYNPVSPWNQDHVLGHSYDGIFQKYKAITFEDIRHQVLVKIPPDTPTWAAILIEPLSIAIYAHEIISTVRQPKNVLIIGSGFFSHVLAFYLLKKNCNIKMLSQSKHRAKSLKESSPNFIHYLDSEDASRYIGKFDSIFSCLSRSNSHQTFDKALKLAGDNCVIDLVNGFNSETRVIAEDEQGCDVALSPSAIRRINWCGTNKNVFRLSKDFDPKQCYVLGHRGSAARHFIQAVEDIRIDLEFFRPLITKSLPFKDLGHFLSHHPSLDIGHRGKVLVEM